MNQAVSKFIGVDVQVARQCPYAVLDRDGNSVTSGWLPDGRDLAVRALRGVIDRQSDGGASGIAVGIDSPRMALAAPRQWYWDGKKAKWRGRRSSDRGHGRHCEIVIAAHRLANPQWTPESDAAPAWMQLGFALFAGLADLGHVHEVFPSASYSQLAGTDPVQCRVSLGQFAPGPKDMLDAYVAAATAREYVQQRGQAIGGGDG